MLDLSRSLPSAVVLLFLTLALLSCGGAPVATPTDPVVALEVVDVVGVADRGLDPSVVAVMNAEGDLCSGVLLANDVLLTARHCVMEAQQALDCLPDDPPAAPTADPASIHVFTDVPNPGVSWASVGSAVLTSNDPALCGADLAIVILAWPIDGAVPTVVSESGIAEGSYVRTVAFGWPTATPLVNELLREHMAVLDVSGSEFAVGEATCIATPGGPAFDETTGQVVGVMSRWGAVCGAAGQFDVFTRVDAFYGLIEDALLWGPSLASAGLDGADGGAAHDAGHATVAHAKKPPTDVGAACTVATDCGAGLCVTADGSQYCSQTCTVADRCPTDFKCVIAAGGASVCVES